MYSADVDLLGFFTGGFGLGVQARALYKGLSNSGLRVNAHDISETNKTYNVIASDVRQSNKLTASTRIITTTLPHIGVMLTSGSKHYFNSKRLIFHLAWEFNQYPAELSELSQIADSCWSVSSFAASGLAIYGSEYCRVVPNYIEETGYIYDKTRLHTTGLPFTFFFAFDYCSSAKRKNPCGVIDAFKDAFPLNKKDNVELLIHAHSAKHHPLDSAELRKHCSGDSRIRLVEQYLSNSDFQNVWRNADCIVSLHRSEGFGLLIAEAIQCGIPVVTTAYSGNMDFCDTYNCYLVDYDIVPVPSGAYDYADNLYWAEPNLETASHHMKEVYNRRHSASIYRRPSKIASRLPTNENIISKITEYI